MCVQVVSIAQATKTLWQTDCTLTAGTCEWR